MLHTDLKLSKEARLELCKEKVSRDLVGVKVFVESPKMLSIKKDISITFIGKIGTIGKIYKDI